MTEQDTSEATLTAAAPAETAAAPSSEPALPADEVARMGADLGLSPGMKLPGLPGMS